MNINGRVRCAGQLTINETLKMKKTIIAPAPLYTFLSYCNDSPLEKEVLDCGAGGSEPPLALFFEYGFRTHGIDISEKQVAHARQFCKDHCMELDISQGDVRELPFTDESMSFVYSYASICHMTKNDAGIAMQEITRVLKRGGLCFVSFCSVDGGRCGEEQARGPGEYDYEEDGEKGIHSLYSDTEPDNFFQNYTYLRKEKRWVERFTEQGKHVWTEIGYIAKKR
ncbi:MAG: class I SAM-dependent methyltransferase [Phycisphaerae bacterium]